MTLSTFGSFLCGTEAPNFFGLDFSTAPQLLFYSYIPIVLATLIIALFIFRKDNRSLQSRVLLYFSLFFVLWVLNILVQWIASYHSWLMFSWQLTALLEVGMYLTVLYFTYVFLNKKDLSFKVKAIFTVIGVVIAAATPTILNIASYDIENCEGVVGPLWSVIYALEPAIIVLAAYLCFIKFRQAKAQFNYRGQIILFGIGIVSFLSIFFLSNFYGELTRVYEFNLWGPLGMVIFIGLLAYLIVKFSVFNIKVIATEILVWALWIMIGGILFVAKTDATRIVTAITEIIAVVFGFMLIGSVRREVEQREKLEVLSNELKAANDRLEILDEQKTQFVSFASHDLKSPINIIKQFASLIADGTYKEPVKVQETILKIKSTADRATQMVDDFLDIRKIEEGKMDYNFEVKDIVSFTKGIVDDYAPVAKGQKNIEISFITTVPTLKVKMDTIRLRQVIQNYLNNSVKYTEASTAEKKNWIKVMITEEQATVLISVKDSGMGMSAQLLPTLFEQFHRDKNTAKKIQGTGLGLFISKQIVIGHGGETWAESEGVDKGSTFFVRLKKT